MILNRFSTVCVLLTLIGAHSQNAYAQDISIASDGEATPTPSLSHETKESPTISNQRKVEQYQAAIAQIELQQGVYSNQLTQELLNLGVTYQRSNKHELAIETFNRALHLNRITEGLYSTSQIPILDNLIASLKALKKWEMVDSQLAYQYWLHSMNFASDSAQMINVNLKAAYWALKAYSLQLGSSPNDHLVNSVKLFKQSADLIGNEFGTSNNQVIEPLNGLLLANYLIATAKIKPESISYERSQHQGELIEVKDISYFNKLKMRSYPNGLKIINRQIEILDTQSTKNHPAMVNAMLKLADWKLMYGKKQSAFATYKAVYQYIQDHDANNLFYQQLFAKPVALPNFKLLTHNTSEELTDQAIASNRKYVKASFNVNQLGQVKNIQVLKTHPEENQAMSGRIVRFLRNSTFRPQLKDGQPIVTEQTKLHFFID